MAPAEPKASGLRGLPLAEANWCQEVADETQWKTRWMNAHRPTQKRREKKKGVTARLTAEKRLPKDMPISRSSGGYVVESAPEARAIKLNPSYRGEAACRLAWETFGINLAGDDDRL